MGGRGNSAQTTELAPQLCDISIEFADGYHFSNFTAGAICNNVAWHSTKVTLNKAGKLYIHHCCCFLWAYLRCWLRMMNHLMQSEPADVQVSSAQDPYTEETRQLPPYCTW